MTFEILIGALLLFILVREMLFLYSTHKLLNKLMSRNYWEYQTSQRIGKIHPAPKMAAEDPVEDFGQLA